MISSEVIQHGKAGEKLYLLNDGLLRLSGENDSLFLDGEGIAVHGAGGADMLIGGGGNDVLISGLGDPTLQAQERLYGNDGNDILIVSDDGLNSPNNVLIDAGSGNDEIYLTHGNTQVDTGAGADKVFIAPVASDLSNRIVAEVYNLSPADKVVLSGVDSAARSGLVSSFDAGVLNVDLTHAYHNYSDLQIAMGSTLSMSLSQEHAEGATEETLLGILEFEESVGLPDDLAILV